MNQIVKAKNLSYKINEKKLFQNISFDLNKGEASPLFKSKEIF